MHWYFQALKNCFKFSGRARRKEFWWFTLINLLLLTILNVTLDILPDALLITFTLLLVLVTVIPSVSLWVRRLHDIDKSGWWFLVCIVPFGNLILLIFAIQEGDSAINRFGDSPKVID